MNGIVFLLVATVLLQLYGKHCVAYSYGETEHEGVLHKRLRNLVAMGEEMVTGGKAYNGGKPRNEVESAQQQYAEAMDTLDSYVEALFCPEMGCLYGGDCLTIKMDENQIKDAVDRMAQTMLGVLNAESQNEGKDLRDEVDALMSDTRGSFPLNAAQIVKLEKYLFEFEALLENVSSEQELEQVLEMTAPNFVYCSCYLGLQGDRCDQCANRS